MDVGSRLEGRGYYGNCVQHLCLRLHVCVYQTPGLMGVHPFHRLRLTVTYSLPPKTSNEIAISTLCNAALYTIIIHL